eukprot:scaffold93901_cov35-Tisochrysis_lutea.AAC.2
MARNVSHTRLHWTSLPSVQPEEQCALSASCRMKPSSSRGRSSSEVGGMTARAAPLASLLLPRVRTRSCARASRPECGGAGRGGPGGGGSQAGGSCRGFLPGLSRPPLTPLLLPFSSSPTLSFPPSAIVLCIVYSHRMCVVLLSLSCCSLRFHLRWISSCFVSFF